MRNKFVILIIFSFFLSSCEALKPKKVDTRQSPLKGSERARKNIEQGGGVSLKNILNKRGGSFEFSSSNPLWRASLEVLDFLPLTTVDYSGGMIISDWYTDNNNDDDSIKITIRFLSPEIRSNSIKVIIHKKKCSQGQSCRTTLLENSKISNELRATILEKAALLEKTSQKKN